MASTLTNKTMCIMKVLFDLPGKITLKMEDGRMNCYPYLRLKAGHYVL